MLMKTTVAAEMRALVGCKKNVLELDSAGWSELDLTCFL